MLGPHVIPHLPQLRGSTSLFQFLKNCSSLPGTVFPHGVVLGTQWINIYKALRTVPGTRCYVGVSATWTFGLSILIQFCPVCWFWWSIFGFSGAWIRFPTETSPWLCSLPFQAGPVHTFSCACSSLHPLPPNSPYLLLVNSFCPLDLSSNNCALGEAFPGPHGLE